MVRPLIEIEHPWLTREQAEAGIWRLTGTRNTMVVEQLLRIMDIYAVSQGPSLIAQLQERDRARDRWRIEVPIATSLDRPRLRAAELAEDKDDSVIPEEPSVLEEPVPDKPDRVLPSLEGKLAEGLPLKATPAWVFPDGHFEQLCSGCVRPKHYDEFYSDRNRWNGKASQCRKCRSTAKKVAVRPETGDRVPLELLRAAG